ncbi:MAG: hypothetical protein HND47_10155 [Chloroflexi bacterium]|nr:hypothetical protein [Chloroflexota bacterium]
MASEFPCSPTASGLDGGLFAPGCEAGTQADRKNKATASAAMPCRILALP